MSERTFDRYELGRKTTTDILEDEKAQVDEIEAMLQRKNGEETHKNRHEKFLNNIKQTNQQSSDNKLYDVKKVQMSVFASNSSELFTTTSRASVVFSVFAIIFMTLLFLVVFEIILLKGMGYVPRIYNYDDMKGEIEKGDVLFETFDKDVELGLDTIITYRKNGVERTVKILQMQGADLIVGTPDGKYEDIIYARNISAQIQSVVMAKTSSIGQIVVVCYNGWYFVVGGLIVLSLMFFVLKSMADKKYNNMLLDRLEFEKNQREKRRKYLADDIVKMQQSKNMSFDNINILSDLLNVNKVPQTKREKKMQKLQTQIEKRRMAQIESIKTNAQNLQKKIDNKEILNEDKKENKEDEEIKFDFSDEVKKELEQKNEVPQQEVQERIKQAEEANNKLGDE